MEIVNITLTDPKRSVSVIVERKRIKTCRLRVFPNKSIKFSVPLATPARWIEKYLDSKQQWISIKLQTFEETKGYAATTKIRNGISIRYLGEDLVFSVSKSKKTMIEKKGKTLCIYTPYISNHDKLFMEFEKWWRHESLQYLNIQVNKLYPIIEKYGVQRPKVTLRKMKTLWGSCSPTRNTIVFNQYLTKAKPACIEYVVLHELVHFLYPNHSKQFYYFLSSYMPDWKARKQILDQDVVHGL